MHSTIQFELHFVFTKTSFWFLNWVAQYGFVIGPSWVSLTLSLTTKYSKRRKAESESRLWVSSQRADGSSFCSKTQLFDRGSSREPMAKKLFTLLSTSEPNSQTQRAILLPRHCGARSLTIKPSYPLYISLQKHWLLAKFWFGPFQCLSH